MFRYLLPALLIFVLFADDRAEARSAGSVTIRTADLDLTDLAGVRTLDRRILHAASDLCAPRLSSLPGGSIRYARCRAAVRSEAAAARARAIRSQALRLAGRR